jgi:hypothetical protein
VLFRLNQGVAAINKKNFLVYKNNANFEAEAEIHGEIYYNHFESLPPIETIKLKLKNTMIVSSRRGS